MIEQFTARIPQAELDNLQRRLAATTWAPEQPAGSDGGAYGVPLSRLRRLVARWQEFARLEPKRVVGVHVTQLFSFPSGDPAELADLDEDEQAALAALQWFWQHKGAFNVLHGQQPQTLAHALADSPAGLLAWNAQLLDESLDDQFVLANVALYWLTGTGGTSIRHYYEDTHAPAAPQTGPTTVPIGLAAAGDGDFRSIRRFAERDHTRITSWAELPGVFGHYSAHTHPDQLADDIRRFFRPLRPAITTTTHKEM